MTHKARFIDFRAIALGFAADIFLTQLFVLALMIVLFDPGSSSECLAQRIDFSMLDLLGLSWGLFFTGLGGFITGRLAPVHRYSNALVMGSLSLLVGLGINADPNEWVCLFGLLFTMPVALLGALVSSYWRD